jgi:hypothetical protein
MTMPEEKKIEPHYQAQAKQLVDCLFDKGYFSETLSRDGMNDVEDLLAFSLQLAAESAARTAVLAKKLKEGTRKMGEVPLGE